MESDGDGAIELLETSQENEKAQHEEIKTDTGNDDADNSVNVLSIKSEEAEVNVKDQPDCIDDVVESLKDIIAGKKNEL